ncbi:hypothetical protein [Nonomuraea harbinensis]|uniref:DUF4913 domain-containing protein n=1 Tax=Nonomuraea harbinensis TaxID=1286938 RepID=A0ABW1C7Z8_9ACTN|nr:hypothetical protein [Nonomuraea harbinensis]
MTGRRNDGGDDAQPEIITGLAAELEELAHTVAQLNTSPSRSERSSGKPPGGAPCPWCWPRMPHQEKAERLAELADWVRDVLFAWPDAPRAILSCWPRHWDVIEELSMLYCAWRTAYTWEGATSSDAAHYLDRLRPSTVERLQVRMRPCGQHHQPDGSPRDDAGMVDRTITELSLL